MRTPDILAVLLLLTCAAATAIARKLTPFAASTGAILGVLIYFGAGYLGLTLLAVFFILGTAATSWKKKEKLAAKDAVTYQSTRNTGQVLANSAVAALLSALALALPSHKPLFLLMMAAAMSSALSDTLSSELGMVYGRRFFNILTWQPDEKGLDGVISIEGLLAGIAGATLIAVIYSLLLFDWGRPFWIILIAGTLGNLADSVLGATFERRHLLSNDGVNFLNTLLAAGCAAALALCCAH